MGGRANILIFGGTGLLGEHITNAVIANASNYGRIVLFTSENTVWTKAEYLDSLKKRGAEIISGDIKSKHDVTEAFNGIDIVISCVGRQVIQAQVDLIAWADEHPDVKHFFPSEYGTDIEYNASSAGEKPHQGKLKVREALKHVSNLDHTYVVTGPYGNGEPGMYLSPSTPETEATGSFNGKEKRAVVIGDGKGQISLTTMDDVGKLVVGALAHLDTVKNKALHLNSFTTTPLDIVQEFEKQTGGEKWDVSYTSLEKLREIEREAWESGKAWATGSTLRRIWAEGSTLYDRRDNGLIGMEDKVESLQTAVKHAIEAQDAAK